MAAAAAATALASGIRLALFRDGGESVRTPVVALLKAGFVAVASWPSFDEVAGVVVVVVVPVVG